VSLAKIVALEESVYRGGGKNNYFADHLGADVLTDTTERSPTYCTPPFRKFDDTTATESWAYLFLPEPDAASAWRSILKREPRCVEWSEAEICTLVSEERFQRTSEIINKISATELMRFRIGLDGVKNRPLGNGDSAIAVVSETEVANFQISQLEAAQQTGAQTAMIYFGAEKFEVQDLKFETVRVLLPQNNFLLNGVARVAAKLVMNALSTCTMVRLGRVMGNYMVWVVPSNLKLIDRATRYVSKLTGLPYECANGLLFEIIEYVEPRMKADQAYPPVVGMAVVRAKNDCTNEQAERFLQAQ
jgi:N-acetylmuramic acid 6-phosphate etherase